MARTQAWRFVVLAVIAGSAGVSPPALAHEGMARQIADLTRRIAASPRDAALYLKRGELHRFESDWTAAESDYALARRLDPSLAVVDLCLGSMLLEQGRAREARGPLDRYVANRPDDPQGWIARARTLAALGESLAAAGDYSSAISRFRPPEAARPEHYLERARALVAAGTARLDEAIAGLDEGMERLGRPVTLELLAIDFEQRAGRYDAALRRIDRAAALSPRRETWLQRRGGILERAGRLAEAGQAYRQALDALRALPAARRRAKMVADLEADLSAALRRLDERASPGGAGGR